MKQSEKYLNATEAAEYLGISRTALYEWLKKGRIKSAISKSNTTLFSKKALEKVRNGKS